MLDNEKNPLIGFAGANKICLRPEMINRHGLITGATGSGKTVTLQTMAETFSEMGIPVFMADVKGDLSGIAKKGNLEGKIGKRAAELGLAAQGYECRAFPVSFWDVFGKKGHPLRTTISDMGPLLLSRLLELNDIQSGVLNIIFRVADDNGLLLIDLKDLRSMAAYVGEEREKFRAQYGQISPASVGAIQRALLRLEEEGGEYFFGEPALNIEDLLQTDHGLGVINILDATSLINTPVLYSCVLLWLLSELHENLPEVGDQSKPRLAFFFDEAHLLFDDISPALSQKVEQAARLIRSKGVGIYFVTQNPSDIPDAILGQLGNRAQHALRAFTPKDQKALKAAAQAFRPNPAFSTAEAISSLGVGEALVSFLDEKGSPRIVEKALILPPEAQVGPISDSERRKAMEESLVSGVYEKSFDRESAYEVLTQRTERKQAEKEMEEREKLREKDLKMERKGRGQQSSAQNSSMTDIFGSVMKQTARVATNTIGREIGRAVLRGLLGGIFGGKK